MADDRPGCRDPITLHQVEHRGDGASLLVEERFAAWPDPVVHPSPRQLNVDGDHHQAGIAVRSQGDDFPLSRTVSGRRGPPASRLAGALPPNRVTSPPASRPRGRPRRGTAAPMPVELGAEPRIREFGWMIAEHAAYRRAEGWSEKRTGRERLGPTITRIRARRRGQPRRGSVADVRQRRQRTEDS